MKKEKTGKVSGDSSQAKIGSTQQEENKIQKPVKEADKAELKAEKRAENSNVVLSSPGDAAPKVNQTPANLIPRILSAIVITAGIIGFFILREVSYYIFDIFIGALMIIAAFEVENLLHKMDRPTYTSAVGAYPVLVFLLMVIAVNLKFDILGFLLANLLLLVLIFGFLFAVPLIFHNATKSRMKKDNYHGNITYYSFSKSLNTLFVCLWPGFMLSFIFIINHFTELETSWLPATGANVGMLGLVLLFATTVCADVCAMTAGRLIKTPKINIEKLGPGKSWSGFVGGILGAAIGAIIVFVIFNSFNNFTHLFNILNVNVWHFMLVGLLCGLFNMCGDMFASLFKRRAAVKDFSQIIPGHGGVMDRVNGLLANAVFVFVFMVILFA